MAEHSIIPPSSADRRKDCNGSAIMELMHPQTEDSDQSKGGTASHELAERMVQAACRGQIGFPKESQTVGRQATNGVFIDEDMFAGAKMYADECAAIMQDTRIFGGPHLFVEKRIHADSIHAESWGTPDFALWHEEAQTLYVTDYKYGHKAVEVKDNRQLITYAVGVLDTVRKAGKATTPLQRVVLTIVQPRAHHRDGTTRRCELTAAELQNLAEDQRAVEEAALGANPTTRTGNGCANCSARHSCQTIQTAAVACVDYIGQPTPAPLTPAALATELTILRRAEKLLKARLSGLEAQAEGLIARGETVPGYALQSGVGNLVWTIDGAEVIAMADALGVDLRKPEAPVTPTQAKKLAIDGSVIKQYTTRPATAAKLVTEKETTASAVFGGK